MGAGVNTFGLGLATSVDATLISCTALIAPATMRPARARVHTSPSAARGAARANATASITDESWLARLTATAAVLLAQLGVNAGRTALALTLGATLRARAP
jgi:hypothetical protein